MATDLVRRGFPPDEVRSMDLMQIRSAIESTRRLEAFERLENFELIRASFADEDGAKRFIDRITSVLPGVKVARVRESSEQIARMAQERVKRGR